MMLHVLKSIKDAYSSLRRNLPYAAASRSPSANGPVGDLNSNTTAAPWSSCGSSLFCSAAMHVRTTSWTLYSGLGTWLRRGMMSRVPFHRLLSGPAKNSCNSGDSGGLLLPLYRRLDVVRRRHADAMLVYAAAYCVQQKRQSAPSNRSNVMVQSRNDPVTPTSSILDFDLTVIGMG
jgi:hypothetical protein